MLVGSHGIDRSRKRDLLAATTNTAQMTNPITPRVSQGPPLAKPTVNTAVTSRQAAPGRAAVLIHGGMSPVGGGGLAESHQRHRDGGQVEPEGGVVGGPQRLDDRRGGSRLLGFGGEHDFGDVYYGEESGNRGGAQGPQVGQPCTAVAGSVPKDSNEGEQGEHAEGEQSKRHQNSGAMMDEV